MSTSSNTTPTSPPSPPCASRSSPMKINPKAAPAAIEDILLTAAYQRSPAQLDQLKQHFLSISPLVAQQRKQIAELKNSLPKFTTTLVLQERPIPRNTKVHHRGDFLNQREAVQP